MRRRDILLQAAALPIVAALGRTARAEESTPFDGATVRNLARDLAQNAYQAPDASLPEPLKNLEYQDYRVDPVRSRSCAVAWPGAALHRRVLPSWLPLQGGGQDLRGRQRSRRADPLQPGPVHLRQAEARDRRHRLRRLPPAQSAQSPRILRRDLRLSRCQLFPRGGEGPGLRPVGAGTRDQDRRSRRRGVPAVPLVLAGAAGQGQRHDRGPCAAGQPERGGGVPIHHSSRQADRVRHRDGAVPAHRPCHRRHRAAHLDVPVRRQRPRARRRLSRRGARFERVAAVDRQGRAGLASARQSARAADQRVRRQRTARLRSDAARPHVRRLPGPRGALREADHRSGSNRSATGATASSSWWRSRPIARSTTTSSPSGGRTIR